MGLLPLFQISSKRAPITGIAGQDGAYLGGVAAGLRTAAPLESNGRGSTRSLTFAAPIGAANVRERSLGYRNGFRARRVGAGHVANVRERFLGYRNAMVA